MFYKFNSRRDCSHQLHVVGVADSYVDRKFIERWLKISSFTAVESGIGALQFLGLDGEEKETTGLDESSILTEIPLVIMFSENILTRVDRCLEEGAEEFIVKPVKLSDVKRLKNIPTKGQSEEDPLLLLPLSSHDLASSTTSSSSSLKLLERGLDCKAEFSLSRNLPA